MTVNMVNHITLANTIHRIACNSIAPTGAVTTTCAIRSHIQRCARFGQTVCLDGTDIRITTVISRSKSHVVIHADLALAANEAHTVIPGIHCISRVHNRIGRQRFVADCTTVVRLVIRRRVTYVTGRIGKVRITYPHSISILLCWGICGRIPTLLRTIIDTPIQIFTVFTHVVSQHTIDMLLIQAGLQVIIVYLGFSLFINKIFRQQHIITHVDVFSCHVIPTLLRAEDGVGNVTTVSMNTQTVTENHGVIHLDMACVGEFFITRRSLSCKPSAISGITRSISNCSNRVTLERETAVVHHVTVTHIDIGTLSVSRNHSVQRNLIQDWSYIICQKTVGITPCITRSTVTDNRIHHRQLGLAFARSTAVILIAVHIDSCAFRSCTVGNHAVTQDITRHVPRMVLPGIIHGQTATVGNGLVELSFFTFFVCFRLTRSRRRSNITVTAHQTETVDNHIVHVGNREHVHRVVIEFTARHIRFHNTLVLTRVTTCHGSPGSTTRITAIQTHVTGRTNGRRTDMAGKISTATRHVHRTLFHQYLYMRIMGSIAIKSTEVIIAITLHSILFLRINGRRVIHQILTEEIHGILQVVKRICPVGAQSLILLVSYLAVCICGTGSNLRLIHKQSRDISRLPGNTPFYLFQRRHHRESYAVVTVGNSTADRHTLKLDTQRITVGIGVQKFGPGCNSHIHNLLAFTTHTGHTQRMPVVCVLICLSRKGVIRVHCSVTVILNSRSINIRGRTVIVNHRRLLEHREIARIERGIRVIHVIQVDNRISPHRCPVGNITLRERTVVDSNVIIGLLLEGCKLDITVHLTLVAPSHGVVDGTGFLYIDTAGTAVTHTVIDNVRTDTLVVHHGQVVQRAAVVQVNARTFGITGTVGNKRSFGKGVVCRRFTIFIILVFFIKRRIQSSSRLFRVFVRVMTDCQTRAYTRRTLHNIAVLHLTVIIDTNATAVTLLHTETYRLTGVDIAVVHVAATVQIYTAATLYGCTVVYNTVLYDRVTYQIRTSAETGMVMTVQVRTAGITAFYRKAGDSCFIRQAPEVPCHAFFFRLVVGENSIRW